MSGENQLTKWQNENPALAEAARLKGRKALSLRRRTKLAVLQGIDELHDPTCTEKAGYSPGQHVAEWIKTISGSSWGQKEILRTLVKIAALDKEDEEEPTPERPDTIAAFMKAKFSGDVQFFRMVMFECVTDPKLREEMKAALEPRDVTAPPREPKLTDIIVDAAVVSAGKSPIEGDVF